LGTACLAACCMYHLLSCCALLRDNGCASIVACCSANHQFGVGRQVLCMAARLKANYSLNQGNIFIQFVLGCTL